MISKEDIIYTTLSENSIGLVQEFMKKNWRMDHPIANNRELFLWQYKGFGPARGYNGFQLAFYKDELIGFRAVIPQYFQVPTSTSEVKKMICMASAMWMVDNNFRGMGLGYTLHNLTEKISDISLAIGANHKTSVPIFLKSGYIELKGLNRYVIPLEKHLYNDLVLDNKFAIDSVKKIDVSDATPIEPNPEELEETWTKSFNKFFAIHRNKEYWQWRYLDSPIFKYVFFGNKDEGFVVARIEDVYQNTKEKLNNVKILRLVELIPADTSLLDIKFENLIAKVLKWGQSVGCCAADFFCSNLLFTRTLSNVGFFIQDSESINSLPSLFQPLESKPYLFNLYLRIEDSQDKSVFNFQDSYFVRSDTDQDRPNLVY